MLVTKEICFCEPSLQGAGIVILHKMNFADEAIHNVYDRFCKVRLACHATSRRLMAMASRQLTMTNNGKDALPIYNNYFMSKHVEMFSLYSQPHSLP